MHAAVGPDGCGDGVTVGRRSATTSTTTIQRAIHTSPVPPPRRHGSQETMRVYDRRRIGSVGTRCADYENFRPLQVRYSVSNFVSTQVRSQSRKGAHAESIATAS